MLALPYGTFLWLAWSILFFPGDEREGLLKVAAEGVPDDLRRRGLISENSFFFLFLPNRPKEESWNKSPQSIKKSVGEGSHRPVANELD